MRSINRYKRRAGPALVLALIFSCSSLLLPACAEENGGPTGPAPPGAVTVTATTSANTVTVSWSAASGANSYVVSLAGGTETLGKTVGVSTHEVIFTEDDGLADGVTYTVTVMSVSAGVETPSTNSPTVTTNFFPWDEYFPMSLHETGQGKLTFYGTANNGLELYTEVAYSELSCQGCHSQASGMPPVSGRGCERCHDTPSPQLGAAVDASLSGVCGGCHGRQMAEAITHGYSDVHRDAGMDCMSCHTLGDVMGDGTEYTSMLEPGQSVVSCDNCHFDTEVAGGGKVAYGQFVDWVLLLNRNGKVTVGNTQSLKWGNTASDPYTTTFVAMAPYYAHTITADGRSCGDCHNNAAVLDWADDGVMDVVTWDAMAGRLTHATGVIPVPPNYLTGLRFDFVDQATPAQGGPSGPWKFLETGPDTIQILFGEALTAAQMDALQF